MTSFEMRLHAEHKARLARFAEAATKHNMAAFDVTVPRRPPDPILPPIADEQIKEAHSFFEKNGLVSKVEIIQRAVLAKFPGITMADIKSSRRTAKTVAPRQLAMYLCKELTNRTLPDIGRRFGGRDHTTVIHAVNKITCRIRDDENFARFVDEIRETL
ncbi:helix-turn-helix domain-containing protein [Bradyrhizobium manausense]